MDEAVYLEGLPGEMSTGFKPCGLEVTRDLEDHLMAHIKYTDGFPDQQTINLVGWKPGCTKSLTNVQFPSLGELLEWLQLIGLRTPDRLAVVGCSYPLEL